MTVRLIAITKPAIPECDGPGGLIAYCARVSNPSNQANNETAPKLLKYLVSHAHWSPFEMVSMVVEIKTTRDIARQILRHRSFSFQEFSQRYAEVQEPPVFREARLQDVKNRQNSIDTEDGSLYDWWIAQQDHVACEARKAYQAALDRGIAKEVARSVLPEGTTPSTLYMSGTVRSWVHYINLRSGIATQKEHREVAIGCRRVLLSQFPELEEVISYEKP